MKKFLVIIFIGFWCGNIFAADLVISGQSNKTYVNASYGHLSIANSSNITVKNCKFFTTNASNASSGGVGDISGSNHITIDSCDFNGDTTTCTGMNVIGSYITIEHSTIHDIADDGFQCYNGDHIYFYHNTICHLYGCGTDGNCGPCYNGHSDGFELGFLDTVEIECNLVYDVRSTSAIIMDNDAGAGPNNHNILIANNIFYTPETGIVVYIFYADSVKLFNNTVWKSNWLGIAINPYATHVEAYNNIAQCIDFNYSGVAWDSTTQKFDYNLVGFTGRGLPAQAHDVVANDPKFQRIPPANDNTAAHLYRDVTPADFALMAGSPAIGKGTSGNGIPTTDFYGHARTAPYDMGAIAYGSTHIRQANFPTPSSGNNSFVPSIVNAGHIPVRFVQDHPRIYDLYGRETGGLAGKGCFIIKHADGGIERLMLVP